MSFLWGPLALPLLRTVHNLITLSYWAVWFSVSFKTVLAMPLGSSLHKSHDPPRCSATKSFLPEKFHDQLFNHFSPSLLHVDIPLSYLLAPFSVKQSYELPPKLAQTIYLSSEPNKYLRGLKTYLWWLWYCSTPLGSMPTPHGLFAHPKYKCIKPS